LICVQPEEAPNLAGLGIPLCVDLYAPRLLEAQFQDRTGEEAVRTMEALRAADFVLFSNPRQRYFYMGLMALAGFDLREEAGAVVPLVAPQGPRRAYPTEPVFVMGGVSWPWQDPVEGLRRSVAHLEKRGVGRIVVYGGQPVIGDDEGIDLKQSLPESERLSFAGVVPYDELLAAYAKSTAALDVMAPSPEREVALAFRHVDYLGCGLPLITGPFHPLAPAIDTRGAGVVGGDVESALDHFLDDADAVRIASKAARSLARDVFSPAVCESPLLNWVERASVRSRESTPIGRWSEAQADAIAAKAEALSMSERLERFQGEVERKRGETDALVLQVRQLTQVADTLSGAIGEVAGYRREAIRVLGAQAEEARSGQIGMVEALAEARADAEKKAGELRAAAEVQARLQADVDRLREEVTLAREDIAKKSAEIVAQEAERTRLEPELEQAREEVVFAREDIAKKNAELSALESEQRRLENDLIHARQEIESLRNRGLFRR